MQQLTMQSKSKVLWIGDVSRIDHECEDHEFEYIVTPQWQKDMPGSKAIAGVFVIRDFTDIQSAIEFKTAYPDVFRIGIFSSETLSLALNAEQSAVFDRICSDQISIEKLQTETLVIAKRRDKARSLRKYYAQKIKEQEELNENLEVKVRERTEFIQASHLEEQEKGRKERQLIRFIQDLNDKLSFDEVLELIKSDLKKVLRMAEPFLIVRHDSKFCQLFYVDQNGLHENRIADFKFPAKTLIHDSDLSAQMANHISRPFSRCMAFPIELKLSLGQNKKIDLDQQKACLVVEHSLSDSQSSVLSEYLVERVGPISMVLDRLLLEKELNTLSFRWERAFEDFRNPIAIVDSKFQIIRTNGVDRVQAGQFCYSILFKRDKPCDHCPMIQAKMDRLGCETEMQINSRYWRAVSYPILQTGKVAQHFVNYYSDQTHFRELHLQLLQSEKIGAIGELAGHIAHELNNPLTGIYSLTQLLIHDSGNEVSLKSDLEEILKATERSQKVIRNLMEFVKGDNQVKTLTSLDELVTKTLPMLKTVTRNFKQVILLRSSNALVLVEPHLLQQVIFNLVNNACQAMGEKGTLGIHSFIDNGFAVLEISDSGPGIPESIKDKVFEPFFTTKEEGRGTGLGLSLSKAIVERFEGKLSFTSKQSVGTSFQIRFKISESSEAQ